MFSSLLGLDSTSRQSLFGSPKFMFPNNLEWDDEFSHPHIPGMSVPRVSVTIDVLRNVTLTITFCRVSVNCRHYLTLL